MRSRSLLGGTGDTAPTGRVRPQGVGNFLKVHVKSNTTV